MKTYKSENSIKDLILANTSVAYSMDRCNKDIILSEFCKAKIDRKTSPDLYPSYSLLVSSVWNGNDDVFSSLELWRARHTPKDHPTNIGHNQTDIVGHITEIWAVDADLNVIPDDTPEDKLPDLMHIITESVIYTKFRDEEKQSRVDELISQIQKNEMFVSMEAIFNDFDYVIQDAQGDFHTVERNESTAFLTKHLRVYGGAGLYEGAKIGRKLKNFIFIGKGYVEDPANKASIIFDQKPVFASASTVNSLDGVLLSSAENNTTEKIDIMSDTEKQLADVKAELEKAKSDLVDLKEKMKTDNIEILEARMVDLKEQLDFSVKSEGEAKKQVTDFEFKATEAQNKIEALEAEVKAEKAKTAEVQEKLDEANKVVEASTKKEKTVSRMAGLVSAGYTPEDAQAEVEKYFDQSDEQWKAIAELLVKTLVKEQLKKEEETVEASSLFLNVPSKTEDEENREKAAEYRNNLQGAVASMFGKKVEKNA